MNGYKAEVYVDGAWNQSGVVWPDRESAEEAARDLWSRWTLTTDHRAIEVEAPPNRGTWTEHVAAHGLPPRSVRI